MRFYVEIQTVPPRTHLASNPYRTLGLVLESILFVTKGSNRNTLRVQRDATLSTYSFGSSLNSRRVESNAMHLSTSVKLNIRSKAHDITKHSSLEMLKTQSLLVEFNRN